MSEFTKVLLSGTISYNRESFPFIYMLNGVSRPECISLMSLLEEKKQEPLQKQTTSVVLRFTMTILALSWSIFNMMYSK